MQYDFLKAFPKRMKTVGMYAMLFSNSSQKGTWKQLGFDSLNEQLNMLFSVLLYIMEQSLKEENCTIDDIGLFIDNVDRQYFRKNMTFDECHLLADFIVNDILSNGGLPMYFTGYDFEEMTEQPIHISYVGNRIVYLDQEIRRTSFYLTEDGYNLLLGTLELENNMKLTIQELIFKMHLEHQSYDKALDDIKSIFNLMRIKLQKNQEAMNNIRRNALDYNVEDYARLQREDLGTIARTQEQFQGYRDMVHTRVKEMEEGDIKIESLSSEETEKLYSLRSIEGYLVRVLDEHQKIFNSHFDLKKLYDEELDSIKEMALVQRFSLRRELYDKILEDPSRLGRMDEFLRPLFNQAPSKIFNLNRVLEAQQLHLDDEDDFESETEDFDEDRWREEQKELKKKKLAAYFNSMSLILEYVVREKTISLAEIASLVMTEEKQQTLIPNVQIFKEIMVEWIRNRVLDIRVLRKEKESYIQDDIDNFQIQRMVLDILDENPDWSRVNTISVERIPGVSPVVFYGVMDENGTVRNIRCSDLIFRIDGV